MAASEHDPEHGPGPAPWRPAPAGWRLAARAVDVAGAVWLTAFVVVELGQRLLGGDPLGRRAARLAVDDLRSAVLVIVAVVLYEVVPVHLAGATLGKALVGLRVVDAGADPGTPARGDRRAWPDPVAAALRALVLYGPPVVLGDAGLLVVAAWGVSVLVTTSGRGLHDRIAGTRVVQVTGSPDPGGRRFSG